MQSIGHYKTIIPIAIPIIPNSPDCGPKVVAEPVPVAVATAVDTLLAREATIDEADVAAEDAVDLAALVAVAWDMVPVVPLGRTRSMPSFLQSDRVTVLVSEERCGFSMLQDCLRDGIESSVGKRGTYFQDRLVSSLLRPRGEAW